MFHLFWMFLQLNSEQKNRVKNAQKKQDGLREVPLQFVSVEDYMDIFEPLLLEECKAQVVRGRENLGMDVLLAASWMAMQTLNWNAAEIQDGPLSEPQVSVIKKCEQSNEFHFATAFSNSEFVESVNENDLLLLSKEKANRKINCSTKVLSFSLVGLHFSLSMAGFSLRRIFSL